MIKRRQKNSTAPLVVIIIVISVLIVGLGGYYAYTIYLEKSYPMEYKGYVEKYSKEYNVDKYLVYAVIKTESGFQADALSNVGARGLMQIMEDTFDWIKFRMGDTETAYFDMYDPEINIKYGCWFLGYLTEEFGNIEAVAAAYHAGRGKVNDWLADAKYSKDGIHLDEIPSSDTAHYVSKIINARDTYVKIYDNK